MKRKRTIWGVGILIVLLASVEALGIECEKCVNGICPPQQPQGWQAPRLRAPRQSQPVVRQRQPVILQRAHPAVCQIFADRSIVMRGRRAVETCIGTGVLVWRGTKQATVLTVHHLFRQKATKVRVVFPNGEKYEAEQVYSEENPDLGVLTIPRPNIEPMVISEDSPPKRGDIITLCGFAGKTGRYIEVSGPVEGYGQHKTSSGKTPHQDLIIKVGAKEGNSGGPMLNSKGELVAITWGTDDRFSHGTYAGRIGVFLTSDRFIPPWGSTDRITPWNARTEQEKIRAAARPRTSSPAQVVPIVPMVGNSVDAVARGMAQDALNQSAKALDGVADLSKDVAQAHGVTTDKADETAEGLADLKGGLLGSIKGVMFGWLKSWGLSGLLGGGILGVVGFFILRKFLAMKLAEGFDKLTDMIPGTLDDKFLDPLVWKAASIVSGKPIPSHANTPGMDPWGNPYPGYQPPLRPTSATSVVPPVQVVVPPAPGPSAREVELQAQVDALKAAK